MTSCIEAWIVLTKTNENVKMRRKIFITFCSFILIISAILLVFGNQFYHFLQQKCPPDGDGTFIAIPFITVITFGFPVGYMIYKLPLIAELLHPIGKLLLKVNQTYETWNSWKVRLMKFIWRIWINKTSYHLFDLMKPFTWTTYSSKCKDFYSLQFL